MVRPYHGVWYARTTMYGGDVPRFPILRYHQRHVVFNGPRLFEERGTGICELRHDAQGVFPRLEVRGNAGNNARWQVLRQAAVHLADGLRLRAAQHEEYAAHLLVPHNLDFRALDKDVLAGIDVPVRIAVQRVGHQTDFRSAALLHAQNLNAHRRERVAHVVREHHVQRQLVHRRVEVRALTYPVARHARGELARARQHAVTVAHRLADDAVVLVDDGQQRVVLDFAPLVHDALRDVFVVEGLFRGRYLGDVVVVHVLCQEVRTQPYFPEFRVCHNLYDLKGEFCVTFQKGSRDRKLLL